MAMTVKSGLWSDPTVWSDGAIPATGSMAHIRSGHEVIYDVVSDAIINDVMSEMGSRLVWDSSKPTRLRANTISLMGVSDLRDQAEHPDFGSPRHEVIFHPVSGREPGAGAGLGAMFMGPTRIHGAPKKGHLRSGPISIAAGATTLTLPGLATSGWRVGDTVIILGTNYVPLQPNDPQYTGPTSYYGPRANSNDDSQIAMNAGFQFGQDEERTITGIDVSAETVTLSAPLTYGHTGMTGALKDGQVITVKPVIANVSRSIRFRSATASEDAALDPGADVTVLQKRAHLMFMRQPDIDLRYFETKNMGRTTNDPSLWVPDDESRQILVSEGGPLLGDPNNVRGRYSIHIHWCGEDLVPLVGATAWAPLGGPAPIPGWAITHHSTNAAIEGCVVSNVRGAGMVSEVGNERGQWADNVVTGCRGDGDRVGWQSRAEATTNHNGHHGIAFENQSRTVLMHGNIAGSSRIGFFNQPQKTNKERRGPRATRMRLIDGLAYGSGGTGDKWEDNATYGHAQAQFPPWHDNEVHACGVGFQVVHRMNQGPVVLHGADMVPMLIEQFHCLNVPTAFKVNEYSNTYYFKDCLWQAPSGSTADVVSLGTQSWDWNFSNIHIRNGGTAFYDNGAGINYDGFFIDITTENVGAFTNAPIVTAAGINQHAIRGVMGDWEETGTNSAVIRRYKSIDSETDLPQPYPLEPYGRKLPAGYPPVEPGDAPYFVLGDGTNGAASTTPVAINLTLTAGAGRNQGSVYGIVRDSVGDRRWPDWQHPSSFPQNTSIKSHRHLGKMFPEQLIERWGVWNDGGTWKSRVWFPIADRFTHARAMFHVDFTMVGFEQGFLDAHSHGTTPPPAPEWPDQLEVVPATQRPLTPIARTLRFLSRTRVENVAGRILAHRLRVNHVITRYSIVGGADASQFAIDGDTLTWASGTRTAGNTYSVTIRATDDWGNTHDASHDVTVVSAARVSVSIADDFNRADEDLDARAEYIRLTGAAGTVAVRSNRLAAIGATATVFDFGSLGTSEQEVSASFVGPSTGLVLLRMKDEDNWIGFGRVGGSTNSLQLWMCVGGVQTLLGNYAQPGTIPARVTCRGDMIKVMWGGSAGAEPYPLFTRDTAPRLVSLPTFDPLGEAGFLRLPAGAPKGTHVGIRAVGTANPWLDNFEAVALVTEEVAAPPVSANTSALSTNLSSVTDWGTNWPFLNMVKFGRGFQTGWGGSENHAALRAAGHLDADGYPVRIPPGASNGVEFIFDFKHVPTTQLAGRYVFRYDGEGTFHLNGSGNSIVSQSPGQIVFDLANGNSALEIEMSAINESNYPRNWRMCRESEVALLDAGETFRPEWKALVEQNYITRFMDWGNTNHNIGGANPSATYAPWFGNWALRPKPSDVSYALTYVPLEIIVQLANETGTNPWINIPHIADETFIRNTAAYIAANLDPSLDLREEWSNEHWGGHFAAYHWCMARAGAEWGGSTRWYDYAAKKATEAAVIFNEEWGKVNGPKPGLVHVLGTQSPWISSQMLTAPDWQANEPTEYVDPRTIFHETAITTYFGGSVITNTTTRAALMAQIDANPVAARAWLRDYLLNPANGSSIPALATGYQEHRDLLDDVFADSGRRLRLVAYEGGTHVHHSYSTGLTQAEIDELTDWMASFSYSSEMGELYTALGNLWEQYGQGPHMEFWDVFPPQPSGSWGSRRYLGDTNPRSAVVDGWAVRPQWWL